MAVRIYAPIPQPDDRVALEHAFETIFAGQPGDWFVSVFEPPESADWHVRVEGPSGFVWWRIFSGPDEVDPNYVAAVISTALDTASSITIDSITIQGFGPFESSRADLRPLNVLVGANGSGKTSLFDFFRAIRDFTRSEIPSELVPGWESREVYHRPGPDRLSWSIYFRSGKTNYSFGADIIGPPGNPTVASETIHVSRAQSDRNVATLERRGESGWLFEGNPEHLKTIRNQPGNQLAFRSYVSAAQPMLYELREHISGWKFFSGIRFDDQQLRRPALTEDSPQLRENGGNLSSVLNWLQSEQRPLFNEIETHIRGVIPAFRALAVRPSGAGRVTLQWLEEGLVNPLTAADLSDGTLRFLFWLTLAIVPNPPALVCIDEPEVGLHPRTLPKIAALLKKMSERAQVIVATHSSYLLAQFDVADITVLRKRSGSIEFVKPASSKALLENLHEFGSDEIELMHRSDELEALS